LPTWEYHEPKELRAASRRELQATGLVNFVDERIVTIEKASDSLFHATSASGRTWRGRKLMLAMGVDFVYPEIPGYTDNFPEKMQVLMLNPI
jgi:thioredoxin reductase